MTTARDVGSISDEGPTWSAHFERVLAHPPEAVWEALTSSEALERWLTTASIEPRAGVCVCEEDDSGDRQDPTGRPPRRLQNDQHRDDA